MAAESIHGSVRELLIAPAIGDLAARQISIFTGSVLILFIAWLTAPWLNARGVRTQLQIGSLWLVLTVLFEFALGYALGLSWDRMASDYNVARGGLMSIGLVVLLLAPTFGVWVRTRDPAPIKPMS